MLGIQRSGYLKTECVYILTTAKKTKLTFSRMSINYHQHQQNYHCHRTKEREDQTSDDQTITCLLPFSITGICKWFILYSDSNNNHRSTICPSELFLIGKYICATFSVHLSMGRRLSKNKVKSFSSRRFRDYINARVAFINVDKVFVSVGVGFINVPYYINARVAFINADKVLLTNVSSTTRL